ncbi:hypothetical protein CHCC14821_3741 [Bacillus paralicheniformis]|nr:hypothetical protein CHCC14821_3741 [Bacillus paralicheniformis]
MVTRRLVDIPELHASKIFFIVISSFIKTLSHNYYYIFLFLNV